MRQLISGFKRLITGFQTLKCDQLIFLTKRVSLHLTGMGQNGFNIRKSNFSNFVWVCLIKTHRRGKVFLYFNLVYRIGTLHRNNEKIWRLKGSRLVYAVTLLMIERIYNYHYCPPEIYLSWVCKHYLVGAHRILVSDPVLWFGFGD